MNPDVEEQIWEHVFESYPTKDSRIVLSDPNYLIPAIEDVSVEVLFEQHDFHSVFKASGISSNITSIDLCFISASKYQNRWAALCMLRMFFFSNIISAAGFIALEGSCRNIRCALIVDCGFSSVTVAPFLDGKAIQQGLVR